MKLAKSMLFSIAAGVLLSSNNLVAQATPHIITFEAPGSGNQQGQGTGCFGCTFGINQRGVVVGTSLDANNVYFAFIRTADGKFTSFQAPGADLKPNDYNGTVAQSINDLGEITGNYYDSENIPHGFVRSANGKITTFDVPGNVAGNTPLSISDTGIVSGYAEDANAQFHAFLRYPNGTFAVFDGPGACTDGVANGCYGSAATNVSLLGAAVGAFADANLVQRGFIRDPFGKLKAFDAPGANGGGTGCPGCNFGYNLWGSIAGTFTDSNNIIHGFLRSPEGTFTTFEAPGAGTVAYSGTGCDSDCPVSLNDFGVLTGSYTDSNFVQHGYVRSPEGKFVTVDPKGTIGTQPEAVNDLGTIIGYYVDANGLYHGFLVVP